MGKTRRWLAVELITELETIDKKTEDADKDLRELVIASGSTLLELHGSVIGLTPATGPLDKPRRSKPT